MLPSAHVLSSGLVVLLLGLYSGITFPQIILWLCVSTSATLIIDLDHLLLQLLMSDRRRIVLEVILKPHLHLDMKRLVDKLHYSGFGIMRMKSHLLETAAVFLVTYHYTIPYSAPLLASLTTHCLMDMLELWRCPERR